MKKLLFSFFQKYSRTILIDEVLTPSMYSACNVFYFCNLKVAVTRLGISFRLLFVLFFFSEQLFTQDFGYEFFSLTEFRSLGVSYLPDNFSAQTTSSLADSQRLHFSTAITAVEFRQLNTRLTVGYQKFSVHGENKSAYSVFAQQGNDVALGNARTPSVFLPVFASANYLRAEGKSPTVRTFDVGSVGLGSGLKYRYFDKNFGVQLYAAAAIHYSTAGFSAEYGTQHSFSGEILVLLPDIIYEGIIFGYRAERMRWNMNVRELNYQRFYHGVFLGFLF